MIFKTRTYGAVKYASAADLAATLNQDHDLWTLCTAMQFGDLLLANDSFGEGGNQEYAVLRVLDATPDAVGQILVQQIETLTVSWIDAESMERYLTAFTRPDFAPPFGHSLPFRMSVDYSPAHRCRLCA